MQPIVDHIQITVKDLSKAEVFYDKLMPILGYDLSLKSKGQVDAHDFNAIEYVHRRKPGSLHHLAFKVNSDAQVDELYQQILNTGAQIVGKPRLYPQHGEHYYALFFKDPGGIELEIVYDKIST
jgi:catechol 2,3-dioxygenase-like lactoylglutathione lyase family enzyme